MVNVPTVDGLTRQVSLEFVKPLRRPLTGLRLFAGAGHEFRTDSWTRETLQWFQVADLSDVVVSMDLPPIQSDDGALTPKSLTIPLLTKDIIIQGRKGAQMVEAGLDSVLIDGQARAMAVEIERALLLGFPANSGGAVTGLLNDSSVISAGAQGALTDAASVNAAVADMISEAVQNELDGPYALVIPRTDSAIYQEFITGTNVRIGDNLPGNLPGSLGGIQAILPTTHLATGNARLVDLSPGNYQAVSPRNSGSLRFGIGDATVGEVARSSLLTETDELMMSRTFRALNAIAFRQVRASTISSTYTL